MRYQLVDVKKILLGGIISTAIFFGLFWVLVNYIGPTKSLRVTCVFCLLLAIMGGIFVGSIIISLLSRQIKEDTPEEVKN